MDGSRQADRPMGDVASTLRDIEKLQKDRRHRDARKSFFVEGVRNFVRVVDHGFEISLVFYSEKLLTAPLARKFVRRLRRSGVSTLRVSPEEFRSGSRAHRASGVGAIVRQRWHTLETAGTDRGLCWIVLGKVRSPGNLGTLIRSSEAVGGAGFILLDRSVDPYDPSVVRASMGSLFGQRFVRTRPPDLRQWSRRHRRQIIGASPESRNDFHRFDYPSEALLFLGEERRGLSLDQRSICDDLVGIPMIGEADSLNLGVAGSLLMYELLRRSPRAG